MSPIFIDAVKNKQQVICQTDLNNFSYILQVLVFNKLKLEKISPVMRALSQKDVVDIEYALRASSISSKIFILHASNTDESL